MTPARLLHEVGRCALIVVGIAEWYALHWLVGVGR